MTAPAVELRDVRKSFGRTEIIRGVTLQIFGLGEDNARAFWNWRFLGEIPDLPKTRAMLLRTCELSEPAFVSRGVTWGFLPASCADGCRNPLEKCFDCS